MNILHKPYFYLTPKWGRVLPFPDRDLLTWCQQEECFQNQIKYILLLHNAIYVYKLLQI